MNYTGLGLWSVQTTQIELFYVDCNHARIKFHKKMAGTDRIVEIITIFCCKCRCAPVFSFSPNLSSQ